jgi:hypothetical protein
MSVEALTIALHHSRARGAAKLILVGIANHDGDGGSWPSIATLAKYAGLKDRRQCTRLIGTLEQLGEVERLVNAGGTHNTADHMRPNLYKFKLKCPPDCDRTTRHRTRGEILLTELPGFVDENPPPQVTNRGGLHTTGENATGADTGGAVVPAPPEPSSNHHLLEIKKETHVIARASREYHKQIAAKCTNSPTGYHIREDSGYCRWCGEKVTNGEPLPD